MDDDRLIIKRRGDDGFKVFSVRIRSEIVSRIDEIVRDTNRSRNEVIGILLEYAVEKCSIE